MIPCHVIEDLLILYVSDECSEETKKMVEEHLATCEKCKSILYALQAPIISETKISPEIQKQNMTFQKSFRKIRHRWAASLLIVALIVPLTGLGFLTRNEVRGQGIAFTSMDEIFASRAFLRALQKKDYEKAFRYLDIEGLYKEMTDADARFSFNWEEEYKKVDLGGEMYYIRKEIYQSEYQMYLQSKDVNAFWSSMMVMNSHEIIYAPIPKEYYEKNKGTVQSLINGALQVVTEGRDYVNVGYDYILEKDDEGVEYYLPAAYGSPMTFIENLMGRLASLIPASAFEEMQGSIRIEEEKILERSEYYRNMGLEGYREKMKEIFLKNMERLEEEGLIILTHSLSDVALIEKETGSWQVNMNIAIEKGEVTSNTGGITLDSQEGKLRISGGYYSIDSDEIIPFLVQQLSIS